MSSRYFWLKFPSNFFHQHDITILEAMPNGKEYLLFYIKLLAESVTHNGTLRFSDKIPYDTKMLSVVLSTDEVIVEDAIKILSSFGLVEKLEDGTFYLPEAVKMMGSETIWAEKKRSYRGQSKDNVQTMSEKRGQCPTDIEKDIDIELDLEKEKDTSKNANVNFGTIKRSKKNGQKKQS